MIQRTRQFFLIVWLIIALPLQAANAVSFCSCANLPQQILAQPTLKTSHSHCDEMASLHPMQTAKLMQHAAQHAQKSTALHACHGIAACCAAAMPAGESKYYIALTNRHENKFIVAIASVSSGLPSMFERPPRASA